MMDEAEPVVLAYKSFPPQHRTKQRSMVRQASYTPRGAMTRLSPNALKN